MTRHGTTCPRFCSQCAGVIARRVELVGENVVVDDEPIDRHWDGEHDSRQRRYSKRGGAATRARRSRR